MYEIKNCQESIKIRFLNGDPLYLQGVGELLKREPGFQVLDGSKISAQPFDSMTGTSPDVAVLISGSGDQYAEELVASVVKRFPESRIIILTECEDMNVLWGMLHIGVHACLSKSVQLEELVSTIRGIYRDPGRFVLSVGRTALRGFRPAVEGDTALTSRETQILRHVAQGASNIEIAKDLFITEATVKRHLSNTYAKLGVSSRFAAMSLAAELGILSRSVERADALAGQAGPLPPGAGTAARRSRLGRGRAGSGGAGSTGSSGSTVRRWKNGAREPTL